MTPLECRWVVRMELQMRCLWDQGGEEVDCKGFKLHKVKADWPKEGWQEVDWSRVRATVQSVTTTACELKIWKMKPSLKMLKSACFNSSNIKNTLNYHPETPFQSHLTTLPLKYMAYIHSNTRVDRMRICSEHFRCSTKKSANRRIFHK